MAFQDFLNAYIACALWSSLDDDGEPLDIYDKSDVSAETLEAMREDCQDFYDANFDDLQNFSASDDKNGHLFWLNRNGHGSGFWDDGSVLGGKLSDAAHVYGMVDLYVGDDDKIYGS